MTATLIAAANEPAPRPEDLPQPPTTPIPGQPTPDDPHPVEDGGPWQPRHRIAQHRRGTNPAPCCDLARYGDVCDCREQLVEVRAAFRRPIVMDLRRGVA